MPDVTRYARDRRTSSVGLLISLPVCTTLSMPQAIRTEFISPY